MNQITSILRRLNYLEQQSNIVPIIQSSLTIEPQSSISIESGIQLQEEPDNCPICLEEITDSGMVSLECSHKLHLRCYSQMIRLPVGRSCPLCRADIQQPQNGSRIIHRNQHRHQEPGIHLHYSEPVQLVRRTLCMEQIITVMGNHPLPINVINRRITRNGSRRPYAIQTVRNNLNMLITNNEVARIGNDYLKL